MEKDSQLSALSSPVFATLPVIGPEEAPGSVVEAAKHQFTYRAALAKNKGPVNGDEFIDFSRRFIALCDEVYSGSDLALTVDERVPVGVAEMVSASQGEHQALEGQSVDVSSLSEEDLKTIFEKAESLKVTVKPQDRDLSPSFANIEWTKRLPGTMFFYAQDGSRAKDKAPDESSLQDLLTRKMFHVPGSAPGRGFKVGIGIGSELAARGGALKSRANRPVGKRYMRRIIDWLTTA